MALVPKIIKSSRFEDGTYQIKPPPFPAPGMVVSGDGFVVEGIEAAETPAPVDPLVLAAEEEAAMILALAREEAETVRREAAAEIAIARAEALEEARRVGHDEGMQLGAEQGRQAVLDEQAEKLHALAEAVASFDRDREAREEAFAGELSKLAIMIAQKILTIDLAHGREAAVPLARAALRRLTDKTNVRVRVHPLDAEAIVAAKQQLLLTVDGLDQLDVVADPAVGLGGCVVETKTGMVDARLATQLDEIAVSMLEVGLDEGVEMDPFVLAAIRALRGIPQQQAEARRVVETAVPSRIAARTRREAPAAPAAPDPREAAAAEAQAMLEAARAEIEAMRAATQLEAVVEAAPEAVDEAPAAPEPEVTFRFDDEDLLASVPVTPLFAAEPAAAEAEEASAAPGFGRNDPSRRAAQALAARLGQARAGKAVLSMEEELALKHIRDVSDAELEAIVRQAHMPSTEIGLDEKLVWSPNELDAAADALAARLGQKPRARKDANAGGLGDEALAQILEGVGLKAAEPDPEDAEPALAPNIEKATDNLYKLLGQKKKGRKRAWYESVEE